MAKHGTLLIHNALVNTATTRDPMTTPRRRARQIIDIERASLIFLDPLKGARQHGERL
jgi:hypothetical protein